METVILFAGDEKYPIVRLEVSTPDVADRFRFVRTGGTRSDGTDNALVAPRGQGSIGVGCIPSVNSALTNAA